MMVQSYIIVDVATGQRVAAARDPLTADEKALARERSGRRVAIVRGVPFRPVPGPWRKPDVPDGYRLLEPRRLAASTLRVDPERWKREAATFPEQWDRWGQGHRTANVAHACHDRGLIEIAIPLRSWKPFLYRRRIPAADPTRRQRP